jgi:hypothetical protein
MKRFAPIMFGIAMAAYCLGCWFALETRNNAVPGGVLQQHHHEYRDGGSKAWRFSPFGTDPRRPLHSFITSFGLFVYPVAIVGIAFSGLRLLRRYQLPFAVCVFAVCAITLARFIMLGVLTAALEI